MALVAASSLIALTPAAALPSVTLPYGSPTRSSSPSPDPPASRTVTMTCAGVGDLHVVLRPAALAVPQAPLPNGVRLQTAYRATSSRTAAMVSGGDQGDISCGEVPVRRVHYEALSKNPSPADVRATDLFDGVVTISLATEVQVPLASAAAPGSGMPFPYSTALQLYLATRAGGSRSPCSTRRTGRPTPTTQVSGT